MLRVANKASNIMRLTEVGDKTLTEYDYYSNSNKFLAIRSATDIQWQFSKSISVEKKPRIFIVWEDREIKGYAIVTRQDSKKFKLERLMINDLMVINEPLDAPINPVIFATRFSTYSRGTLVSLMISDVSLFRIFEQKVATNELWLGLQKGPKTFGIISPVNVPPRELIVSSNNSLEAFFDLPYSVSPFS